MLTPLPRISVCVGSSRPLDLPLGCFVRVPGATCVHAMAELLGFPPETRTHGAPLTTIASSSPSAQDDTILATAADSVVISNVHVVPRERRATASHARRESVVQAQVNDLVLSRERERCRSDLPSEEASGLMAASLACRLELGEARDREYLEQRSGYEERFGSGIAQVTRELDQQQAARASAGKRAGAMPPLRLSRLGEQGGNEAALRAAEARRELFELGRQESARKFLQWQELAKRTRVQPRNGKFSPRELQKLSPRYGHPGRAFVPAWQPAGVVASASAERACARPASDGNDVGAGASPGRLSIPTQCPGLPLRGAAVR